MTPIDDIIAEGKLKEAEATLGPWHRNNKVGYVFGQDCVVAICGDFKDKTPYLVELNGDRWNADADLIAFIRTHFLDLITALEQARAALAEREREIAELRNAK